jgi:hypothetical protein
MSIEDSSDLLCLTCRKHGHGAVECANDECNAFEVVTMLDALRKISSKLCKRCDDYKILDVLDSEDIVDITDNHARIDSISQTANVMNEWVEEQQKYNLVLGPLRSITLYGSCPLCRLIFRVFPARSADNEETSDMAVYYVRPFPSYDRQSSFLKKTDVELKTQYAIQFSVESEEKALGNVMAHFGGRYSEIIMYNRDTYMENANRMSCMDWNHISFIIPINYNKNPFATETC